MKRLGLVAGVLAVTLAAPAVLAQSKPNFAGKWTLVPDPNAPASGTAAGGPRRLAMAGLGPEFTVAQDDKTVTVTTTNPQLGEIKAVYKLDGSDSSNPLTFNNTTIDRVSRVKWDGARMIIATTASFNGNTMETTQIWMLTEAGDLVVESASNIGGNPQTSRATYKKS
jgi:hypothetical protein